MLPTVYLSVAEIANPGLFACGCGNWICFDRVCRKTTPRPGYVVIVRPDPGCVVKQCPRIVINTIFDCH